MTRELTVPQQHVATQEPQIIALLDSDRVKAELAKVIPPELNVDALISKARLACLANPDLMKCSPQSTLMAIKRSVAAGLELNGRDCHLVPFKGNTQFIIDVKGYMKLGMESGLRSINAHIVHAKDNYREWANSSEGEGFTFSPDHRIDRGPVIGALCVVTNASGAVDHEFMPIAEINAIKARSRAQNGPWATDENEMRKKTVIRRMSKRWPLGSRLAAVWNSDDDRLEQAQPAKVRILPDEAMPADALPEPETANLLPAPADQDGGNVEENW